MDVQESLREFMISDLSADPSVLSADYDLLENGVVDSLGMFELVRFIEERLGVEVADDELVPENFQSLNAITGMIERLRANA